MANFYKLKRWKNKRSVVLKRDEYLCQECKRYGRTTQATTVHHIFPLSKYPKYKLTTENLVSLCHKCHEAMHDRNSDELTDVGKKWMEKVSPLLRI